MDARRLALVLIVNLDSKTSCHGPDREPGHVEEASDPIAADKAYRQAIEIDSTFADAHLNLGRLLRTAGAVADALSEYKVAESIDREDATTYDNIGVASQDLGQRDDAVTAYELAVELAPQFADARYNLAAVYEELGDKALAVQHLRAFKDILDAR